MEEARVRFRIEAGWIGCRILHLPSVIVEGVGAPSILDSRRLTENSRPVSRGYQSYGRRSTARRKLRTRGVIAEGDGDRRDWKFHVSNRTTALAWREKMNGS